MRTNKVVSCVLLAFLLCACSGASNDQHASHAKPSPSLVATSPSPAPTSITPKNGDYDAKGVVTKVNLDGGSVEMDHEEIVGVMPAMRMEFYVSDKKFLDGLAVGDKVDFVLRYKDHTETVVNIKKAK